MTSSAKNLRDWLRNMNAYDNDIYEVLGEMGVKYPEQDFKGFSEKQFKSFMLKMKNARNKKNQDLTARNAHQTKCDKIKKQWEKISGNTQTMKTKKTQKKSSKSKTGGNKDRYEEAKTVKQWMRKKLGVIVPELFEALVDIANIMKPEDLANMTHKQWAKVREDAITRRNKETQDQKSKTKLLEQLTKFKKIWISEFNIKKSKMATKNTSKGSKNKKQVEDEETQKLVKPLVDWMRKNEVFCIEIKEALIEVAGVTCPDDLATMSWNNYREVERVSRVKRNHNTQVQENRKKLEDKLIKFRKVWKEQFNIADESMMTDKTSKDNSNKKEDQTGFLVRWMRANGIFSLELKDELVKREVYGYNDLNNIKSQDKCDEIVRMARVERKSNNKSKESSNRLDAQLTRFEKMWQVKTGNESKIGTGKKN